MGTLMIQFSVFDGFDTSTHFSSTLIGGQAAVGAVTTENGTMLSTTFCIVTFSLML